MTISKLKNARWKAVINYRSKTGTVDVEHWLEELVDIDALVESGPHWDTIESIMIHRVNHLDGEDLTLEKAKKL